MKNYPINGNKWFVLVNPNAGNRSVRKEWKNVRKELKNQGFNFEHVLTEWPMHAIELTRQAILSGYRRFIAVGGDGTMNEMVHSMMQYEHYRTSDFQIGLIPAGTGNDWGRMFRIPGKSSRAVATIAQGRTFLQDVGVISYRHNGENKKRYFVNVAGMGFDALVAQKTNKQKASGKGNAFSYLLNLFTSLFEYRPKLVNVEIDHKKYCFNVFSMCVGICKYNGGGMMQLPLAVPDDGLLDITIIKKIGIGTVFAQLKNLYTGRFIQHPKVVTFTAQKVGIYPSTEGFMLEADGESLGYAPCEVSIIPRALQVIVGSGFSNT